MTGLVELVSPLGGDLLFCRLEGEDGLSLGAEYRLLALSRRADIRSDELLGYPMSVQLRTPAGAQREFNGIAAAFEQGSSRGRLHEYRIMLRPWTWLLTRTSDCRIFQDRTTREIIAEVFADHELADYRFELGEPYPSRPYCVQYRESDFDFVTRLMEQDGMHGYWLHQDGRHTIVIADRSHVHEPIPGAGKLSFLEPGPNSSRQLEGIRRWSRSAEIQSARCVLRDFDFEKPRADLQVSADALRPEPNCPPAELERFDFPGPYAQRIEGERLARVRVESLQQRHEQFHAEGNALGLASGRRFVLQHHPHQDPRQQLLVSAASYRVVDQAQESGAADEEFFRVSLQVLPADQPFMPERCTQRPLITGPQTAIVVGRAGEEIHTDRYGRIKVQFHWDRYGRQDESSSCWIRVAQPWAGQSWGMIAIPRVGQEVVVEFLEGDPDRPIVTGRVYNAEQLPPYALPEHMTRSGIRSRSSLQGGVENYNEIRFEDRKGEEELRIHAERDQTLNTEHDRVESVGNDSHLGVGHDQFQTIKGERHLNVMKDASEAYDSELHRSVARDSIEQVDGERHLVVKLDSVESVGGEQHLEVAADRLIRVEKSQLAEVLQDWQLKVGGKLAADADQEIHLKSGVKLVLEAGVQISLVAGNSFVDIGPGGVTISGTLVMINSGGSAGSGSGTRKGKLRQEKPVRKPKAAKPPPP
ncbi:MAG: type secretion system tip protein VgrG [Pseudomonadota bacterium]|jgi:type VI secretion system secreted protein VgrG